MKLWIDATRPAPEGYIWVKSVNEAKYAIKGFIDFQNFMLSYDLERINNMAVRKYCAQYLIAFYKSDDILDMGYDAGEYVNEGGNYIKLLEWLEEIGEEFPIHIHSQNIHSQSNSIDIENMRRIIKRNGWSEI